MYFQVQMMSAVSGEQLLRRVKQEVEPPPQYSPEQHRPMQILEPCNVWVLVFLKFTLYFT